MPPLTLQVPKNHGNIIIINPKIAIAKADLPLGPLISKTLAGLGTSSTKVNTVARIKIPTAINFELIITRTL
jgi:hypothetical protein